MKSKISLIYILLFGLVVLNSCSKKDDEEFIVATEYTYKGTFQSSAHPTSGTAIISKDKTKLLFESFKSDNGPDLNIYLTANLTNIKADYIDLGDIKGLNGNYSYNVNSTTNFAKYKYVVIWCVDFDVNFGYATLAP